MLEQNEEAKKRIASLEEENQNLEKKLEPLYTVIGRNYYEKPEGYEQEIEKAAVQLDATKQQIRKNYMEILSWKGIRLCPNCGSEVEQGAIFCGECGIRIEAVKEVDENSILCSRCGAKNEKGKKFCVICGQKLVDIIKAAQEDSAQGPKWSEGEPVGGQVKAEIETKPIKSEVETRPIESEMETRPVEAEVEERAAEAEIEEEPAEAEPKPLEEAAAAEEGSNEAANQPESDVLSADTVSESALASTPVEGAGMPQENVIFCPECGNRLPADALFCGECGTRIVEEIPVETHQEASMPVGDMPLFCTECGTKLEPGSAFCSECGTPVATGR